jgi:hypothetical protein
VALLTNLATTQPTMRGQATASSATVNLNLAAATGRTCTNGTGLAALPGSITPSANSLSGTPNPWFAIT